MWVSGEAAVIEAVAERIEDDPDGVQYSLLDAPVTDRGRALVGERGVGRPPGARNKRTERTITWLLARHRDPREALLAVTDLHPADLAAQLGCTLLEAQQEIRQCAIAVLPYVAQKLPVRVDLGGVLPILSLMDLDEAQRLFATMNPGSRTAESLPNLGEMQVIENTPLSDALIERVGQSELDKEGNDQ